MPRNQRAGNETKGGGQQEGAQPARMKRVQPEQRTTTKAPRSVEATLHEVIIFALVVHPDAVNAVAVKVATEDVGVRLEGGGGIARGHTDEGRRGTSSRGKHTEVAANSFVIMNINSSPADSSATAQN